MGCQLKGHSWITPKLDNQTLPHITIVLVEGNKLVMTQTLELLKNS